MKPFLGTFMRRITEVVMSRLARSERGRQRLSKLIDQAQGHLGIGAGGDVASSGEQVVFDELRKYADPSVPLCIFDVGANKGQFLAMTKQTLGGVPSMVHCFEPSPSTFEILSQNAEGQPGSRLNPFGLGKEVGEFDLFSDSPGSGFASLSNRRLEHFGIEFGRKERVQIRTLDSYCAEHGIEHIDLLKLDVEGHEMEVLSGGTRMFREHRVRAVTFEFGGCNIDSRTFFQDYYYFFNAHGMPAIYRILPFGGLDRIGPYQESLEQFRAMNFLVLADRG